MTQTFVLNSLTPKRTRYIKRKDLEDFLKREFKGYGALDFQIEHINDRWKFYAPEIVTEAKIMQLIDEIEDRKEAAKAAADQGAAKATTEGKAEP
ncbi:hypothetical protein H2201_006830 [Coniosporium apollinis]|uniref:Uncharacterized protein n=1 Tax=Coniosporium apollinis TaxID=61459 RepID=A0ABQ9NMK5_9PEZI|nr:hypothetical protein H2201_006830 [Coniosporium apollinis]